MNLETDMLSLDEELEASQQLEVDPVVAALYSGTINQLRACLSDVLTTDQVPMSTTEADQVARKILEHECKVHSKPEPDSLFHSLRSLGYTPNYDPVELGPVEEDNSSALMRGRSRMKAPPPQGSTNGRRSDYDIVKRFMSFCPEFEPAVKTAFSDYFEDPKTTKTPLPRSSPRDSLLEFSKVRQHRQHDLEHGRSSRWPDSPARANDNKMRKSRRNCRLRKPSVSDIETDSVKSLDLSALDMDSVTSMNQLHRRRPPPRSWVD